MTKLTATKRATQNRSARSRRRNRTICESLEKRQLMSLTISVQETGGATSATVTSVGQVVNLEVLATITGAQGDPTIDALQDVDGRFISSAVDGHAIAGNLAATNVSPFTANGASTGVIQDLNGDGNLDVGGTGTQDLTGDFFARAASRQLLSPSGTTSSDGHSLIFEIATLSYTVTSLGSGGRTDINFVVPTSTTNIAADWFEDGPNVNNFTSTFQAGTPFVVSDNALVVAPTAVNDSANVYRNVPTDINELANDNVIRTLNPSSVTIATPTAHGTTAVQTDGSILYTPNNNYVGSDSFTYHVADTDGRVSNTATVNLNVTIPPPPTATADTTTTVRNTPVTVNVLSNDTAPVGTLVAGSVIVAGSPADGTAVAQSDGTILYTPTTGFVGTDSFTYTVADSVGDRSSAATVSVTVTRPALPVAGTTAASTVRNVATSVNVLAQDTTTVGTLNTASVAVVTQPAHGTAAAQSDGTILYTPATGYTGSDSFTYTVADSLGDASNPGTVNVTVGVPAPPVAMADTFTDTAGTPDSLAVLTNDTAPYTPVTVAITTVPSHGTAVPQSDGTVLYTPTAAYLGTDTFDYTVTDSAGDLSNIAPVTVTIGPAPAPIAGAVTAPVLTGQTNSINVLSGSSSVATLVPGTVAVVTQGTEGTATANIDGTISYIPDPGFVGADTFTYTVGDTNLNTSLPSTVTVEIGTPISSAKGAAHSLTFTDAAGGLQTIKLNIGTAEVFFSGTGTVTVAKNGSATVAGSNLDIGSITLTGTTAASSLSIRGVANKPVTVGGITDAAQLKSISAPSTALSGTVSLNSAGSLQVASIAGATITVGSAAPGHLALTAGAITSTTLTSAVPITTFKSANYNAGAITAPSITNLTVAGEFDPNLTLSAGGGVPSLKSAKITGAVDGGTWAISGSLGVVSVGSLTSAWTANLSGGITSLTIKAGGLSSNLTATNIGSLAITGNLTANITAASAKSIRVSGGITSAILKFTGAAGLGQLTVGGAISGATITSDTNIAGIAAGTLTDSTVTADVGSAVTLSNATAATLGTGRIGTLRLTGKTGPDFANTSILASKIGNAAVGSVNTDNGSSPEGIATVAISGFSGTFADQTVSFGGGQLRTEAVLSQFVLQRGVVFGDFEIAIVT